MSARIRNREEYWQARSAAKPHRCGGDRGVRCTSRIEIADRYVEVTMPPSAEFANGEWHRVRLCVACALAFNADLTNQVIGDGTVIC